MENFGMETENKNILIFPMTGQKTIPVIIDPFASTSSSTSEIPETKVPKRDCDEKYKAIIKSSIICETAKAKFMQKKPNFSNKSS